MPVVRELFGQVLDGNMDSNVCRNTLYPFLVEDFYNIIPMTHRML